MKRILLVVSVASFVSSMFIRMTDPLVPQLSADFSVEPRTAALVGTAFALPWAFMQPVLGPVGDLVGKTRVILTCVFILTIGGIIGAVATSFPLVIAARLVSGAAAGGVFPVSMALFGDLVPIAERQVRMGGLLTASISGTLMGAILSGVLADIMPWRVIFLLYAAAAGLVFVGCFMALRKVPLAPPRRVHVSAMVANYRMVWSNPRTIVCYGAVFTEGIVLIGIFPFVAVLLVSIGETRTSIAGLVLSAFMLGGIAYSQLVGYLVPRLSTAALMAGGGGLAALALLAQATVPPWPVQFAIFFCMGLGFYTLHACILVFMTELAPEARGTAVAGHALSYYMGQAIGPVLYGLGFARIGPAATIALAAVIVGLIGVVTTWLLQRLSHAPAD
ncbi:MAG TPA: MFS transporter [Xanthobacteraceae bacterium]|nr:MFS transporter [Xanthobacteraceae bacterium]